MKIICNYLFVLCILCLQCLVAYNTIPLSIATSEKYIKYGGQSEKLSLLYSNMIINKI